MVDGMGGQSRDVRRRATAFACRGAAVLALVALVALAAVSAAFAQSRGSSAQPQWIVFTARPNGTGVEQVYRVQPSGKGLKKLTTGAYPASAPAFSPDGKRIAFTRLGSGIFSMNLDGTGVRRLTTNARDNLPTWSPDGKQIAFIRPSSVGWGAFVMSSAGAGQRRLLLAPSAGRPTWTTAGLLIPSEGDLTRVDPKSGRVFRRFGANIDAIVGTNTTAVSPNLSTLTYVGSAPADPGDKDCGDNVACPRFALYIEDLAKHKQPRILVRDAGPASFTRDGKRLAFVARNKIVLWTLASGKSTSIGTGRALPTVATPPVWQPR